jgi:hypothetical protein
MWGLRVAKAYSIHIILVAGDTEDGLAPLNIVNVDGVVACACNNLATVSREAYGPDLSTD